MVTAVTKQLYDTPGWHPISTAPRDGRDILLHGVMVEPCVDAGKPTTVIAYWTMHNDGGWVWHGAPCSKFTHWHVIQKLPEKIDA